MPLLATLLTCLKITSATSAACGLALWLTIKRRRPWVTGADYILSWLDLTQEKIDITNEKIDEGFEEMLIKYRNAHGNMDVLDKMLLPLKADSAETEVVVTDRRTRVKVFKPITTPDQAAPPLVLYFKEGGFVIGHLEVSTHRAKYLAHCLGAVVASFDYPLAPEHTFPENFNSAFDAAEYVLRNPDSIGVKFDPDRVITYGFSAGGNLATTVAVGLAQKGFTLRGHFAQQPSLKVQDTSSRQEFFDNGFGWDGKTDAWAWNQLLKGVDESTYDFRVSALYATHAEIAKTSPGYVTVAKYDCVKDGGQAYADRLRQAGKLLGFKEYPISHITLKPVWKEQVDEIIAMAAQVLHSKTV